MTDDETTTEQLAAIEGQAEDTPATGYTPPEGWRVLRSGELLQPGDHWVDWEGTVSRPDILHGDGTTASGGRYIRRIKPEVQPEAQPEPVQVREGRWRTRNGLVKDVTAMPTNHEDFAAAYPWWDGVSTWRNDGRWLAGGSTMDLLEYLGPIEQQPQPEPQPPMPQDADQMIRLLSEANHNHVAMIGRLQGRINDLETIRDNQAAAIEELRSEVSYVQRLLGESRQRVTTLEELVTSLRTINEASEKAVRAAGLENTDLRHRLNTVAAEWAEQAETMRQLRLDLAEVTRERDQYLDSYQRIFGDLETIRETTKAETVEAIVEWLQAFRGCNSPALALLLLEALPSIFRSIVGLNDTEEIE